MRLTITQFRGARERTISPRVRKQLVAVSGSGGAPRGSALPRSTPREQKPPK